MKKAVVALLVLLLASGAFVSLAKKKAEKEPAEEEKKSVLNSGTFAGMTLRGIGPALFSGRIGDFAVHPNDPKKYFVAVSSGGVWKTENAGTTYTPVFDGQGSYSIGCVTIDPGNPLVVWVGTGENNSQRSVGYGDGLYKSEDFGTTWKKVGLEESEHIGMIRVDPRDSNVVYVAAQGPLWSAGGDRGLYKTIDGGKTWSKVLEISENTGISEVHLDPRNPDVLYASAYQRRRHTWALINGGPESGIYKSTDAGETWKRLENGLPKVDLGRIGVAVSPANPDVIYAIVEAAKGKGGFFRSTDAGANWRKQSDYMSGSGQYYNEIFADPEDVNRVYSMDTWMHVTYDGGKTFQKVGETWKHVDNHALWIDPADTDHLLSGCDGGVYETWDRGATWAFKGNLPVTQFYKATPDNTEPFYYVYAGTQDNATQGGPSRTKSVHGITNFDWYVTVFGDGFKTQIDPVDPDVVYSQWQNGGLVRYDRKTGEKIDIQPQPKPGEDPSRWNWDAALIISPHSHTRLYFASQRVYRSDDRGDSWTAISPDLTRQIDRNTLEMMGRVWSVDAVAKNNSTSFYGNIVALSESPLVEGLIYAGTDDGLVQITEDGGETWRAVKTGEMDGAPDMAYVNRLEASLHDADTVFAALNNHKKGDFKPYLYKSTDRGRTWTSITGDLPERGSTYAIVQDHEKANLLFAGTEFAAYFTVDGGSKWVKLGGMPVVAARDLEIQRRENDLVVGSFGRGIFILDDYTPLRHVSESMLEETDAGLFPVKKAWMYIETSRFGIPGKGFQGDSFYTAPNPPFGAVFTYYLKDSLQTRKEKRHEAEKEIAKEGGDVAYPSWDDLRAEDREEDPAILLTVRDDQGNVVQRITGPAKAGIHRVAWNLRYPAANPVNLTPRVLAPWSSAPKGPMALPGTYSVSLAKRVDGVVTELAGPVEFETEALGAASLPEADRASLLAFQKKVARLQRAVLGSVRIVNETQTRLTHLKRAVADTPGSTGEHADRVREIELKLKDIQERLSGDRTVARRSEPTPPSIVGRVQRIVGGQWDSTSAPTGTNLEAYDIASGLFAPVLDELTALVEVDLKNLEDELEEAGAPWTPGRVPRWQPE